MPLGGPLKYVNWMIDGTECQIAEPTNEDLNYVCQSGKSKLHSIKYEVVCQVSSGRIMWVHGGGPASEHDRTLFKAGKLLDYVPIEEIGIADKGYWNKEWKRRILTPIPPVSRNGQDLNTVEEVLFNETLSSLRIEIERVFGRMKVCFSYLTHSRERDLLAHRKNFTILANAFNISLEFEPLRAVPHQNLTNPPVNLSIPARAFRGD